MAESLNTIFALGTLVAQGVFVICCVLFIVGRGDYFMRFIGERAVLFSFIITFSGTIVSLIYSELIGFEPCSLCWVQRIFLYSQALIYGIALWKKEKRFILDYGLGLSTLGALVAAYHYYGQTFNASVLPCDVAGGISLCAQRFFVAFGYITIPMMSFTAFACVIMCLLLGKRYIHTTS